MRDLDRFEAYVRVSAPTERAPDEPGDLDSHPFETRNIHPELPRRARALFDDGYFSESVFEAFKHVEKEVKRVSGQKTGSGFGLMMSVFDESKPKIRLNALAEESEIDEQRGFRHMFAGAQAALRNPRGHETELVETPDRCLDYLAVASVLLRRIDEVEHDRD